jgi:hypothetical protein
VLAQDTRTPPTVKPEAPETSDDVLDTGLFCSVRVPPDLHLESRQPALNCSPRSSVASWHWLSLGLARVPSNGRGNSCLMLLIQATGRGDRKHNPLLPSEALPHDHSGRLVASGAAYIVCVTQMVTIRKDVLIYSNISGQYLRPKRSRGGQFSGLVHYRPSTRTSMRVSVSPKQISFYDLRHSCATLLADKGVPPRVIM